MPELSRRSGAIGKIAWQEAYTRVCAIRGESAGETDILRTAEQNESQIQIRSVAGRIEHQNSWDKKQAINNVIGVPWTIADGKWTTDSPATKLDPLPPPPVPFEGARVQREIITRTDIETFGTTAGCPGCNAIRSGKRAQVHSDSCRVRIEECLKTTPEGAERPDRRSEVLNEALAKEVERNIRREEIESTEGELAAPR